MRKEKLFEYLAELGIETNTHHHAPVFTVEEANKISIPGAPCKNLFLTDSKKRYWLFVALKPLSKKLAAPVKQKSILHRYSLLSRTLRVSFAGKDFEVAKNPIVLI